MPSLVILLRSKSTGQTLGFATVRFRAGTAHWKLHTDWSAWSPSQSSIAPTDSHALPIRARYSSLVSKVKPYRCLLVKFAKVSTGDAGNSVLDEKRTLQGRWEKSRRWKMICTSLLSGGAEQASFLQRANTRGTRRALFNASARCYQKPRRSAVLSKSHSKCFPAEFLPCLFFCRWSAAMSCDSSRSCFCFVLEAQQLQSRRRQQGERAKSPHRNEPAAAS